MYIDEEDDDVTFKVAYDTRDHGDHVLDAGMYGWGPCAPWNSWCLLEPVGDAPGQAPVEGAFTKWAKAQPLDAAVEGENGAEQPPSSAGEGGGGLLSRWHHCLRSLAERWSRLSCAEKAPLLASAAGLTSGARQKPQGAPGVSTAVGSGRGRKRPPSKRGGVRGRARDADGVPAPALLESIKRKHRCKDGAMCRWHSLPCEWLVAP